MENDQFHPSAPKKPIAVALGYDAQNEAAPRITATGRGAVAEQILNIAFAHGVKVREDAPLVEILGALEVDALIPLEAYASVAEILSHVYRANAQEQALRERTAARAAEFGDDGFTAAEPHDHFDDIYHPIHLIPFHNPCYFCV